MPEKRCLEDVPDDELAVACDWVKDQGLGDLPDLHCKDWYRKMVKCFDERLCRLFPHSRGRYLLFFAADAMRALSRRLGTYAFWDTIILHLGEPASERFCRSACQPVTCRCWCSEDPETSYRRFGEEAEPAA
jgi:hypothetical protein